MTERPDHELLADFARSGSEEAFATLVTRHVNLVYSAALRFTGNSHHAQEITQAVFIILVRKSRALSPRVVVSGWLYQTARLTSLNFLKRESRRRHLEQEVYMQSALNETGGAAWDQVAPLLDEAMGTLSEADRNAVVLRFFENKTAAEIAAALRMTEAAAHKRVNRALEKLRRIFRKRGVALTAAALAGAVSTGSVQAAPTGLAATVTASAAKGVAVPTTITTLVKGTMNMMTWLKLKFAAGVGVAALVVGSAATVATTGTDSSDAADVLRRSVAAYAALTSYGDEGTTTMRMNVFAETNRFSIKLARPNLYRIEWQHPERAVYTNQGAVWSNGREDFLLLADGQVRKQPNMELALSVATGVSGGASATVPGTFFDKESLGSLLGLISARLLAEEPVNGVDCYVVAKGMSGGRKQTLWIGKQDYLLRRIRTVTSAEGMKAALDQAISNNPELKGINLPEPQQTIVTETHENIVLNPRFTEADFGEAQSGETPAEIARKRVNDAKQWSLGFRLYAMEHGGQLPKTFAEAQAVPRSGLTGLDDSVFEIVTTGNWNTIGDHARTVLLREREARVSPDGGFMKVYALADGHVEALKSPDGDYAAAERQHAFITRRR